ncbi:hypothetical protein BJX66DRAFT_292924 [Aspergillus keveii]|uniref:F-box domain-containing protein n=1 Tax=Aspergillus keveii TaxID=714993 RepID=A0ABR4GK53_9EURO
MTVFDDLPLEIIALILDNIPDLFTLLSAIKSAQIFSTAFTLRPDKIAISCFEREWSCPCPPLDKPQDQNNPHQRPNQPRRWRHSPPPSQLTPTPATKITHSTCGRLLLELVTLARSHAINPQVPEAILRVIYPYFQNRMLEESLFPIAVAIARSYLQNNKTGAALNLLQAIYGGQGVFRWRAPAGLTTGVEDPEGRMWTATRDRRRISLYPVARLILEIKDEMGFDGGRPVTQGFRGQVWGLRKQFRNSPVLLIGKEQVALFPWEYLHDQPELLKDGIWVNDPRPGNNVDIPARVRAIVKVTKWGFPSPRETLLDATVRAHRVTHRAAFWRFEGEEGGDMLYEGSGGSLRIYMGFLQGLTGPVPPEPDAEVEAGLEKARAEEEARKRETRRLIITGQRGNGEFNASEVLAAAGDYTAERAVVDILLQDKQVMRNGYLCIREILRTFHLGTVLRLLRRVEREWEVTEGILEAAARNGHSGAGIVRFILEHQQRGLEFESGEEGMAELIVRVAANNEGCGRQIMEVLFERQEARDQGVYEALCAAEGSG